MKSGADMWWELTRKKDELESAGVKLYKQLAKAKEAHTLHANHVTGARHLWSMLAVHFVSRGLSRSEVDTCATSICGQLQAKVDEGRQEIARLEALQQENQIAIRTVTGRIHVVAYRMEEERLADEF